MQLRFPFHLPKQGRISPRARETGSEKNKPQSLVSFELRPFCPQRSAMLTVVPFLLRFSGSCCSIPPTLCMAFLYPYGLQALWNSVCVCACVCVCLVLWACERRSTVSLACARQTTVGNRSVDDFGNPGTCFCLKEAQQNFEVEVQKKRGFCSCSLMDLRTGILKAIQF